MAARIHHSIYLGRIFEAATRPPIHSLNLSHTMQSTFHPVFSLTSNANLSGIPTSTLQNPSSLRTSRVCTAHTASVDLPIPKQNSAESPHAPLARVKSLTHHLQLHPPIVYASRWRFSLNTLARGLERIRCMPIQPSPPDFSRRNDTSVLSGGHRQNRAVCRVRCRGILHYRT